MRLLACLALLLGLLAGPAAARCEGPSFLDQLSPEELEALDRAAEALPFGEGLLWRASRGDARLLLVGTLHLPDPRHEATLAALEPAVAEADLVLVEATRAEQDALGRAMMEEPDHFFLTGPSLIDLLGEEDWGLVAEGARARGIPPFTVARFRPAFLAMTLSLPACLMQDPTTAGGLVPGLDAQVIEAAEAASVPLASLEPWDTLFDLMNQASLEEQLDMLRGAVTDLELSDAVIEASIDLYFQERVAAILELGPLAAATLPPDRAATALQGAAELDDWLLDRRNAAWIPVIEDAAAGAPRVVVAAGAAHLPGEGGVLRLLERAGWQVERLDRAACCEGVWAP
jgi:hypothetical protein